MAILFSNSMQVSTLIDHNWFNLMLIQLLNLNNAPERPSFTSSTKWPLPSIPFVTSNQKPLQPLEPQTLSISLSFFHHPHLPNPLDQTVRRKRHVQKKKRKKERRIKWAKSKKAKKVKVQCQSSQMQINFKIQCKSKVQSPKQKSKSLKSTLRTVGHFVIIKPFSTLKPQPHITTTKALSHEALSKSSTRTTTVWFRKDT